MVKELRNKGTVKEVVPGVLNVSDPLEAGSLACLL
jgi:hypothetical protein